jgi:hypothetical protein
LAASSNIRWESPILPDEKPEAVEVTVESDLAGHGLPKLLGIIDLDRPQGRIVDFKSSGKTPDPEQVAHLTEIQTTAYSSATKKAKVLAIIRAHRR